MLHGQLDPELRQEYLKYGSWSLFVVLPRECAQPARCFLGQSGLLQNAFRSMLKVGIHPVPKHFLGLNLGCLKWLAKINVKEDKYQISSSTNIC